MNDRDMARMERKIEMAVKQAQSFEDSASEAELNLVRLEETPQADRDGSWHESAATEHAQVANGVLGARLTWSEVDRLNAVREASADAG